MGCGALRQHFGFIVDEGEVKHFAGFMQLTSFLFLVSQYNNTTSFGHSPLSSVKHLTITILFITSVLTIVPRFLEIKEIYTSNSNNWLNRLLCHHQNLHFSQPGTL
jgi:hypothetical protein